MNKLEEYRDRKAEYLNGFDVPVLYKRGFNAAIALDLPVKFLIWYRNVFLTELMTNEQETIYLKLGMLKPSADDLYQYWIDNIYKPE